jgi:hypothetical protein
MFQLQAYLDETGDEAIPAMGSCIASAEAWVAFHDQWQAVLRQFGVSWFHAVDFENRRRKFRGMAESSRAPFRAALLDVLTQTVHPSTGGGFFLVLIPSDNLGVLKWRQDIGKGQRKRSKTSAEVSLDKAVDVVSDPYSVCLGQSIRRIVNFSIGGQDTVKIFIAHRPARTAHAERLCEWSAAMPRFRSALEGAQCGMEMQPLSMLPLQAADFAAYYLMKRARNPQNPVAWVADMLFPNFAFEVAFNSSSVDGWA